MISKFKALLKKKNDTFIGIIDEDGVGLSQFEDECSMTFSFIAYIKNNGEVQEKEAVVHKIIPSLEYNVEDLEPLSIVKLTGIEEDLEFQKRIHLESIIKTDVSNDLLNEVLKKRTTEISIEIFDIGVFIKDRISNNFESQVSWNGKNISLSFSEDVDQEEFRKNAKDLLDNSKEWSSKFSNKISEILLPIKNETWREEDEDIISEDEIVRRIQLTSITFYSSEEFEAWFSDDNIFYGHFVNVDGNINGTLQNPSLSG